MILQLVLKAPEKEAILLRSSNARCLMLIDFPLYFDAWNVGLAEKGTEIQKVKHHDHIYCRWQYLLFSVLDFGKLLSCWIHSVHFKPVF